MKRKKILLLLALLLAAFHVQGQTYFASDDNFFVTPNSTSTTSLDILLNDFYGGEQGCSLSELTLDFPSGVYLYGGRYYTAKGVFTVESATRRLQYQPNTGASGTDSFTYQFECNASGTPVQRQATVYIHVNNKPGVISEANCYIEPEGITFDIGLLAQSDPAEYNVSSLSSIIAGDIDNDGLIEMLVIGMGSDGTVNNANAKQILAYNYNKSTGSLDVKYVIPITGWVNQWANGCFAVAKITGGMVNAKPTASIFFANPIEKILYRYDLNGTDYTETWRVVLNPNRNYSSSSPFIADLMGNGRQQIICADRIYDADTGTLLVEATDTNGTALVPTSGHSSYSFGRFGHYLNFAGIYESSVIAADIDGDGLSELIGGDYVYKVNIGDFTSNNTSLNTYRLYRRANYKDDLTTKWDASRTEIGDGGAALADVDNDGQLEVVVSGTVGGTNAASSLACIYIYNPRTGELMHTNAITDIPRSGTNYGPSRPFIGDIDGDGYSEFCLTALNTFRAYKLNLTTNLLEEMWRTTTTDGSASTTLSMFDFTQDGTARMIYRDITSLRIIRSTDSGSVDEYTFNVGTYSGTLNEYPIVIDVDGDGHAEILATASPTATWGLNGSLRVYAATGEKKWAPARQVWNQVAYNPLYVNDDLTIPSKPISPATAFYAADGTATRPFNNFLQQSTSLNREGTMIMLGPDLQFDISVPKRLSYDGLGGVDVSVGIINRGDASFTGPIYLALYAQSGSVYTLVGDYTYANAAGLGYQTGSNTVGLSFSVLESAIPASYDMLYITVNLSSTPGETPVFAGSDECHGGYNNIGSGLSLVNGELVLCEGASGTLSAYPENTYVLKWYDKNGVLLKTGADKLDNSYTVTKNSQEREYYLVECYASPTAPQPVSSKRDSVFVYLSPSRLTWTGSDNDGNWHNFQNWSNPDSENYPQANIPRSCTTVTIPDALSYYPDLTNKTSGGSTDYSTYTAAYCDTVKFSHGGEIQHPDLLNYSHATVSATLNSHHWYAIAPPLKNFYTRDFHYNDIVPLFDDIYSYTRGWARRNPQNNYYEVNWTKVFNTPNTTFEAGQGFSLWIDDKSVSEGTSPLPHAPFSFSFPREETEYYIYDGWQGNIHSGPYPSPRTNSYRFIFDGLPDSGGDFTLKIDNESPSAGDLVLVGNPFMSNLDFDKFYAANSSLIQPYYYVPDDNDNWTNYYNTLTPASSTIGKYIAPMQAFMVRLTTSSLALKANGNMTVTRPGNKLRNTLSPTASDNDCYLILEARQGMYSSKSYIGFSGACSNTYNEAEDVPALFAPLSEGLNGIILSTATAEGMKVFVNNHKPLTAENITIPVSLRTLSSEDVVLNLSNLPSVLSKGYKVEYVDSLTGAAYDVSSTSMRRFGSLSPDSSGFIDGRLWVRISKEQTSVEASSGSMDGVMLSCRSNVLCVSSDALVGRIEVYNLSGVSLLNKEVSGTRIEAVLPYSPVYLVRVQTRWGVFTGKVVNGR